MTQPATRSPRDRPVPPESQVVEEWLTGNGIEFTRDQQSYSFALPGERKLQTAVRLDLGEHALGIHAFICRRPDEEHERVYRWMLERNMRLFGVAFALDSAGDVYLDARLPLAVVTVEELDRLMGEVLETSDSSFNTLLELGFESAIRKEWAWRRSRGESTRNLEAFRGWLEPGDPGH